MHLRLCHEQLSPSLQLIETMDIDMSLNRGQDAFIMIYFVFMASYSVLCVSNTLMSFII